MPYSAGFLPVIYLIAATPTLNEPPECGPRGESGSTGEADQPRAQRRCGRPAGKQQLLHKELEQAVQPPRVTPQHDF
jgi:hypothetical protein